MNLKFELTENGISIEYGDDKFLVSYEDENKPWNDAVAWCEEHEARLPTVEQAMLLFENRDAINAELKKAGEEPLGGWLWTNREHSSDPRFALCVSMYYGDVCSSSKLITSVVRSVSAFQL